MLRLYKATRVPGISQCLFCFNYIIKMAITFGDVCMFLVGFNLLQPFQVIVGGSMFAIKRFGGNPNNTSLLVGRSCQGHLLFNLIGAMLMFGLSFLPGEGTCHYLSIACVWLTVVLNVVILLVYAFGNGMKSLKTYFWSLFGASFCIGITEIIVVKALPQSMASFPVGLGCIGIFVCIFHCIIKLVVKMLKKNVDYWLVTSHLLFNVVLSIVSAICWTVCIFGEMDKVTGDEAIPDGPSFGNALLGSINNILIVFAAHVFFFLIYPVILPYNMCKIEHCPTIITICLAFDCAIGFTGNYLSRTVLSGAWTDDKFVLNLIWLGILPIIFFCGIFIYWFHSAKSRVTKLMKENSIFGGFMTVFFYIMCQMLINIAFATCFDNTFKFGTEKEYGVASAGYVCSLCVFALLLGLWFGSYFSDAHARHYTNMKERISNPEDWPTYGRGFFGKMGYWTGKTIVEAFKTIPLLFTTDVVALVSN
ncbi:hypothetical protein BdWA1_000580 [Babesia duncani]|uniref:Uncharacterized protein n=1 Tax=Babesia duncani TaxID=323732 RepID=A0AAD9PNG8_9APIC|nr:hypothetical protein BdWA1_000580 [Babesia duncani]